MASSNDNKWFITHGAKVILSVILVGLCSSVYGFIKMVYTNSRTIDAMQTEYKPMKESMRDIKRLQCKTMLKIGFKEDEIEKECF